MYPLYSGGGAMYPLYSGGGTMYPLYLGGGAITKIITQPTPSPSERYILYIQEGHVHIW